MSNHAPAASEEVRNGEKSRISVVSILAVNFRQPGRRYYILLRKILSGEKREPAHKKSATSFQAARRVENRHASTG